MLESVKKFFDWFRSRKRPGQVERPNSAFIGSIALGIVALIVIFFYAKSISTADSEKHCVWVSVFTVVTLIAFASFAVGGIIGFLFGIPRTLQHSNGNAPANGTESTPASATNTNLEQISDWLTKILVGVGLTQIASITQRFNDLSYNLGKSLMPHIPAAQFAPIAGVIMILFAIDGFLIVYLWTRLFLAKIQDQSFDDKMNKRDEADKQAVSVANNQLNLPQGVSDYDVLELYNTFKKASGTIISNIFFRAVNVRKLNWSTAKDKMERTIPIFKALIKLDDKLEFPENYAELGYALKDKTVPDFKEALDNLSKAVEGFKKTGNTQGIGILLFNRAYCRIKLDQNYTAGKASADENYTAIKTDLDEAAKETYVKEIIDNDDIIKDWIALNNKQ